MIEQIGEHGAGFLAGTFPFAMLMGSIWISSKILDRFGPGDRMSDNVGCTIMGLLTAVIFGFLMLVFAPSLHILESYSCRSADDYDLCMNPPDYN